MKLKTSLVKGIYRSNLSMKLRLNWKLHPYLLQTYLSMKFTDLTVQWNLQTYLSMKFTNLTVQWNLQNWLGFVLSHLEGVEEMNEPLLFNEIYRLH